MRPKHRNRRLVSIALGGAVLTAGVALMGFALNANQQYFYKPSEVIANDFVTATSKIRVGGLVVEDSVVRGEDLAVRFQVSDFEPPYEGELTVLHRGILPDLFKENSGVVLTGSIIDGALVADEVLAKHDENYRPKLD